MKREELEQLMGKWKKILRLEDWDIVVRIVPEINEEILAVASRHPRRKGATIRFSFKTHQKYKAVWEKTLIHELMHVKLFDFDDIIRTALKYIEASGVRKLLEEELDKRKEDICYDFERIFYQLDRNRLYCKVRQPPE